MDLMHRFWNHEGHRKLPHTEPVSSSIQLCVVYIGNSSPGLGEGALTVTTPESSSDLDMVLKAAGASDGEPG